MDWSPELLSPLDLYLLHLILEFCPRRVVVLDLACGSKMGTTSVVCLSNRRVYRVFADLESAGSLAKKSRLLSLLRQISRDPRALSAGELVLLEPSELAWQTIRAESTAIELPVFLITLRREDRPGSPPRAAILEEHPSALVVVLSLGKFGECGTAQTLARTCHSGSMYRLALLRECGGALFSSGLALVSRRSDLVAPEIVSRIEQLFTTNYDFLRLVNDSCTHAIERPLVCEWKRTSSGSSKTSNG